MSNGKPKYDALRTGWFWDKNSMTPERMASNWNELQRFAAQSGFAFTFTVHDITTKSELADFKVFINYDARVAAPKPGLEFD